MSNLILSGVGSGSGFLPETLAYIAAENGVGNSFTGIQETGIDRWFRDMMGQFNGSYSTFNVYSRIVRLDLSLTGTAVGDAINAVNPGVYDYTNTGSPVYSTINLNVTYNGINNYSNSNFVPNGSSTFATADFTGYGFHKVDTNHGTSAGACFGAIGGGNSFVNFDAAASKTILNCAQTAYNQIDANVLNGLWDTSYSSAGTLNAYYNGAVIKVNSSSFSQTPTRSLLYGAFNNATPGFGGIMTLDFTYEKRGAWTNAEVQMMYNATKALKAVFGITWL